MCCGKIIQRPPLSTPLWAYCPNWIAIWLEIAPSPVHWSFQIKLNITNMGFVFFLLFLCSLKIHDGVENLSILINPQIVAYSFFVICSATFQFVVVCLERRLCIFIIRFRLWILTDLCCESYEYELPPKYFCREISIYNLSPLNKIPYKRIRIFKEVGIFFNESMRARDRPLLRICYYIVESSAHSFRLSWLVFSWTSGDLQWTKQC